jgi:2-polyprenyl-3-methyl-5-hydroxy-6-metoxy-1,4-benzoquinol methylase
MAIDHASLLSTPGTDHIRCFPCPCCFLCGTVGELLYVGLTDKLFGAPGTWNVKRCARKACGLLWLDPMPFEPDIPIAYQRYYTHQRTPSLSDSFLGRIFRFVQDSYLSYKYDYAAAKKYPLNLLSAFVQYLHPGRRAEADFSVFYLKAKANGRLLDVGCGSGQLLQKMQELGWQAEGIDFDSRAVQNARSKGLTVQLGTLSNAAFPSDSFDAITMSHLVEHISEPASLLSECYRILKPGACAVIVTPNGDSLAHRVYRSNWRGLEPPRHLNIFTVSSIGELMQKAGFRRIISSTTIRGANTIFVASRSIERTGAYQMGQGHSLKEKLWGQLMQAVEWGWSKFDKQAGEEIAVIGHK